MIKDHLDLMYVEWVDSRGTHESWIELEDMANEYCTISSVGWVIKEDEELIHLVPHLGDNPDQGCGDMVIPKVSIIYKMKLNCRTIRSPAHKVLHDKNLSKQEKIKRGEDLTIKSKRFCQDPALVNKSKVETVNESCPTCGSVEGYKAVAGNWMCEHCQPHK